MKKSDPVFLAFFTAFATSLYILENLIPKPLPFIKLGLANVIVILLLWKNRHLPSFVVLVSKSIIGGLLTGLLFSPMTVISLTAGVSSYIIMQFGKRSRLGFSLLGISILGATSHNLMQLAVVKFLLIKSEAVWRFLPLMIILGVISGFITGYLANLISHQKIIDKYLNKEI